MILFIGIKGGKISVVEGLARAIRNAAEWNERRKVLRFLL
jgi:hypothetical protein